MKWSESCWIKFVAILVTMSEIVIHWPYCNDATDFLIFFVFWQGGVVTFDIIVNFGLYMTHDLNFKRDEDYYECEKEAVG
jgi:hypothetical protein